MIQSFLTRIYKKELFMYEKTRYKTCCTTKDRKLFLSSSREATQYMWFPKHSVKTLLLKEPYKGRIPRFLIYSSSPSASEQFISTWTQQKQEKESVFYLLRRDLKPYLIENENEIVYPTEPVRLII